jgi:F0F1-type ATP synthase delta subunit
MNTTDLRKKVHEIIDSSDDEVIKAVYTLLQTNDAAYILGTTVEQYNKEIDEAEAAIDSGKFITQEDLEKEIKKW